MAEAGYSRRTKSSPRSRKSSTACGQPGAPSCITASCLPKGDSVALASGMAKVTYDCGAEVVLQGPCEFWLQSSMMGYLTSGRITANVPRRAFSFAILSPQVDLVDLGTSFGVEVGANGPDRAARLRRRSALQPAERRSGPAVSDVIHVTANKAMEFGRGAGLPSDIAMNEEQFARLIALRRAAEVAAGHLVEDKLACGWRPTSP